MTSLHHPSAASRANLRLHGRRVMLRPLALTDFARYRDVRLRNEDWLVPWEPSRLALSADPARDQNAFSARCAIREKERQSGTAYGLGLFVGEALVGEVNLNGVQRGAVQSGTLGYWIDRGHAGHGYVAEGVVALARFAFEDLNLHRLEICIIPRNTNSRRVMEKLEFRHEGVAVRYLEINGAWEDHVRYGVTLEEWLERRADLARDWLTP